MKGFVEDVHEFELTVSSGFKGNHSVLCIARRDHEPWVAFDFSRFAAFEFCSFFVFTSRIVR